MSSADLIQCPYQCSDDEAITFTREIMLRLNKLEDCSDLEGLINTLTLLHDWDLDSLSNIDILCDEFQKSNCVTIMTRIILNLNEKGYFLNENVLRSITLALCVVGKLTDTSHVIAAEVFHSPLMNCLVSDLLHKPYTSDLENYDNYQVVVGILTIIHNVVRDPDNKCLERANELKLAICEMIECKSCDKIDMICMLTLSYLVNENELKLLDKGKNTIKTIIECVEKALSDESKHYDGFSIWELLNALKYISINDNMKLAIVEANGLKALMDVLKQSSCDEDIEKALSVVWNLCFNKDIQKKLVNDFNLKNIIRIFMGNKYSEIKKNCNGIMWLIEKKPKFVENVRSALLSASDVMKPTSKWKFDVFLSYAWADKPIIVLIRDELKKNNINLWIDVDQMKGSTLEAMANGIENSNIFVMSISDAYRTSPNCRTEAEYAFSLKKPIIPLIVELKYKPTSWLGMIMGSKTYYEFSSRRTFEESFSGLINNIEMIRNNEEPMITASKVTSQTTVQSESTNNKLSTSDLKKWTTKDVANWLTEYGMEDLKIKFANIDGKLFTSMINMNSKSSDYLYKNLESSFGMTFMDILKFNFAVSQLDL